MAKIVPGRNGVRKFPAECADISVRGVIFEKRNGGSGNRDRSLKQFSLQ